MEPDISIIIPTLNEAENLPLLVPKIHAAMKDRPYEILIVDDRSRDRTPDVCRELSKTYPLRLFVRENPRNGLSGAVLAGMGQAKGRILLVMDADLQHPPERIPEVIAPIERNDADFALGSRHVQGGQTDEKWGLFRRLNSSVATLLARPFAGEVSDPMSGFFALHRSTYENATRLTPLGYKIGLELMCKARVKRVKEVPIRFGLRAKGESKLTLTQQFKYLEHLSRLYDFTFPRLAPALKFLIVLGLGWFVGLGTYLALIGDRATYARSSALAYFATITVTAIFHLRYVRTQREFIIRPRPWFDFAFISLMEWITCAVVSHYAASRLHEPQPVEVFAIAFGAATLVRYILRKELLQDIRGLRKEIRREELT